MCKMGIDSTHLVLRPGPHDANAYLPGETINGTVEVSIKGSGRSHKLSKAYVKLRGQADTKWTTGSHDAFWEIVWLVRQEAPLIDIREGKIKSMTPGRHVLPFSFTLPDLLPHSQKHYEGKVVYRIETHVKSAHWWSRDGNANVEITVPPYRNLSREPRLAEPLTMEREAAKSSWIRSDPGPFRVTLERQGFVGGDTIIVRLDGDDKVLQALVDKGETVCLKRWTIFWAGRDKTGSNKILDTVKPDSVSSWRHVRLTVPADEVTIGTDSCPIINVAFFVKVYDLNLPVTLGTVPVSPGK